MLIKVPFYKEWVDYLEMRYKALNHNYPGYEVRTQAFFCAAKTKALPPKGIYATLP